MFKVFTGSRTKQSMKGGFGRGNRIAFLLFTSQHMDNSTLKCPKYKRQLNETSA